jgi:lambda repressor-like predicted transcriptional regulator
MSSAVIASAVESQQWDPAAARTPAEFVELMRALKDWSGLSYRQLSRRAAIRGDVLPHSTLAAALSRHHLPREELVAAFGRACALPADEVTRWVRARKALAVGHRSSGGQPVSPRSPFPPPSPIPARTGRSAPVTGGALTVVLALVLIGRTVFGHRSA